MTNFTKYRISLWVFLIILNIHHLTAQEVFPGGGTGSYNLTLPPDDYQGGNIYDEIGGGAAGYSYATLGPNYTGPFQTHQWWTSALWNVGLGAGTTGEVWYRGDSHSENMHPLPLQIDAGNEGFDLRYRDNANQVSGANQVNNGPATIDLRVGLEGSAATETSVDGYGDFHAIFRQEWAGTTLLATGCAGSPYFFLERQGNQDFEFYHQGVPGTINDVISNAEMEAISLTTNTGPTTATFALIFPPGTTIGGTAVGALPIGAGAPFGSSFVADVPNGSNYITIAVLPDNSPATFQDFAQYGWNFITNTEHSYNYDELNSALTTNFDVTTTNVYGFANTGTLMALYRHQWMNSPEATSASTGYIYPSVRGDMQVIRTGNFATEMTHMGILPTLGYANTGNDTQLWNYIDNFSSSLFNMNDVADGYNKDQFTELITNLQLARQIGHMAAFNNILNHLRDRLTDWLVADDGDYDRYFAYSPTFNWMAHYPNGFGSSGTFVDAHFHIGYFMMAAAIVARYDPAFVTDYGEMIDVMVGSINEYRKDMTDPGANGTVRPWFPYLRYFDPYAGHSWADPMANDQESVSEAIHFAAGVFLWGETTQNDQLRDLGALLFTTETEAARQYWFDVDAAVNGAPYANAYNHRHLTMLYNWGGNYATFFGVESEYIHGITYIPGTGASTWLGTNIAGAAYNYSEIADDYSQWGGWGQAINVQHATHDPTSAINAFNTYEGMWGNDSKAFTYHWIHTYDSAGLYDGANVQADITGFGTFVKDSCNTWYRHYMFYNPPGDPAKTVHATDGTCWYLPEDTVITYSLLGPDTIGTLDASATTICNGDDVTLTLNDFSVCDNDTVVEYQYSTDGTNWITVQRITGGGADQLTVTPPGTGTVYYRAVMINEYDNKPEMLCDLNDTLDVSEYVTITINSCGCLSPTVADITPNGPINLCAPANQTLTVVTDAPAGYEYTWYEISGPTNVNSGPVVDDTDYDVMVSGRYYVVIADPSDPGTCFLNSDTVEVNINTSNTPSVTLSADQNNVCPGTLITFTVTDSTNGGTDPTFAWDINGTTVGGDQNQIATDTLSNGSTVNVVMTSNDACASPTTANDNVSVTISSSLTPSVTLSADQNNVCPGTLITFTVTDSTNGGANPSFDWDINGTTVGGDQNQIATDTLSNGSTVNVVMTSNDACASPATANDNVSVTISSSLTPSVTLSADQNNVCPGTLITFTVTDSTNGGADPTFTWDINGTTVAGDQNQIATDTLSNGSTVNVVMTSNDACASPTSANDNVSVTISSSLTPSVTLSADQNNVCPGTLITFTVTDSINGGTDPTFAWDINGTTVAGDQNQIASDTISDGSQVTVTMTSNNTCATPGPVSDNHIVAISSAPVPSVTITASQTDMCPGEAVTISVNDSTNGGPDPTFAWTINGNSVAGDVNEITLDTLTSSSSVGITMTSSEACATPGSVSDNITITVGVGVIPSVVITADQTNICNGNLVSFNITEINNEGSSPLYEWLINGISSSNTTTFDSDNLQDGDIVSLLVTSSEDCATPNQVESNPIVISVDPCLPIVIPNVFTPNNDGEHDNWELQGFSGNMKVEIFNRWGSLVYKSTGQYEPWDGKRNGERMPVATYYYIITTENSESYAGSLSIVY